MLLTHYRALSEKDQVVVRELILRLQRRCDGVYPVKTPPGDCA